MRPIAPNTRWKFIILILIILSLASLLYIISRLIISEMDDPVIDHKTPTGHAVQDDMPPSLPSAFWGAVTVGGQPTTSGVPVTAWTGEIKVGETTVVTTDGVSRYVLQVLVDDLIVGQDKTPDDTQVTFRIGSEPAAESATWQSGAIVRLDLTTQP